MFICGPLIVSQLVQKDLPFHLGKLFESSIATGRRTAIHMKCHIRAQPPAGVIRRAAWQLFDKYRSIRLGETLAWHHFEIEMTMKGSTSQDFGMAIPNETSITARGVLISIKTRK
jgi:hypothetical protein